MKFIKTGFLSLSLLLMLTACQNQNKNSADSLKSGPEYTSAYVCPMHCSESGSESEGKCPVCGMDYVKYEEHVSDGHIHKKKN
ncbi:MAG: hypothetical protein HKN22_03990 [Bacteroidia bacterium]|nr:hypothetical protein [Bacteroidia bacterium]